MWDRPDLLNRAASILFAAAVLLIAYGAMWTVVRMPVFALREVQVTGQGLHVTRAQVDAIVKTELKGTFFTLNLPQMRSAFEKLPWVREVNLKRRWPSRLEVAVVEHVPLARWGNVALVNTHGEVFDAAYDGKLPVFNGPSGTSKEIAIQYDFFRRNLAAINAVPVMVQVTPRRAWQVRLEGGPTLELGREDVEARLARYIQVHERTVGTLKRRIEYVDLRYANGFAVRIPELKGEPADAGHAVKPGVKGKNNNQRREAPKRALAPVGAA
ncbi:MAG: ftsQ [Betaproteobacteria bacterium]|nr:ftsQ [Betaproteobacteria bacterium]